MLLNSLQVAGLRCFRNPVTLTDFDERVNIIFGPNEAGKSTLVWALILAFCNRHDVGGEQIMAYRPWGTDLSPTIEVEFTAAGKRYRLEKGFLDQAKSILSEQTGGSYLRLADGKRADERVREFMLARFPGRSLAKGSDWGLAHLLWMPQDKERLTSPSLSRHMEDHLRQAVGATLFTPRDNRLLQLIDDRYAAVFTPRTGRISAKSELSQVETEYKELECELKKARDRLESISTKSLQLEAREKNLHQHQQVIQEMEKELGVLTTQAETVKQLKSQVATAEAEQKAALERWRLLQQDWDYIQSWGKKSQDAGQAVKDRKKELVFVRELVEKLQTQVTAKQKNLVELTQELKRANHKLTQAYKLRQSQGLLTEISSIRERYIALSRIEKEILNLRTKLGQQPVPTLEQLQDAQKQQKQIEIGQGQAKAQGIQMNFRPDQDFKVTVITNEGKEEHSTSPKHPLTVTATCAEIQLEIATVGTFTIKSGAENLREILSQLTKAKNRLTATLHAYQVGSVTDLQQRYNWAQNIMQEIENLKLKRANVLGEYDSIDDLKQEGVLKNQQLKEQCDQLGIRLAELSLAPLADTAELEQQTKDLETKQDKDQKELEALREEFQKEENRQRTLEQEINEYARLKQTANEEQEKRLAPYQGSKEELEQSLKKALDDKEQKTRTLTQLKKELPPDADSLERRAARKKLELAKNQQKTLLLREEIAALRAEISLHSEEGLYSKIGELEEKREIVQSQYRWLAAQAQAIKLLHELAHARHETMLSSITDPIREGINDLVRRVTDQPNRSLELAADLSFSGIHVSNEELPQPVDVFSIGTQEQMLLLARLALAHFLSADERQLVVLDDALVNSDGPRRERILSLLAEAADQRLQLVILTCHPDMYQQLPGRRYSLSG